MTGPLRKRLLLLLIAVATLAPMAAEACPVCFSAEDGSRIAFIITTVFLSILPWMMVGSFVVWYRHQSAPQAADTGKETNPE